MNNPRRIQRHLVKALAAGAVIVAAALPVALATAAGAVTPAITSVTFTPSGAGNTIGQGSSGTVTVTGVGFAGNGGKLHVVGCHRSCSSCDIYSRDGDGFHDDRDH